MKIRTDINFLAACLMISCILTSLIGGKGIAENKVTKTGIVDQHGRFVALSDGTIKDIVTGLMWSAKDNGFKINWPDAINFCTEFTGGGYTDWRLPKLAELETLRAENPTLKSPTEGCSGGYYINRLFHITCCCLWAAEEGGQRPAAMPFNLKERNWHHQTAKMGNRVLPVRNIVQGN